MIVNIFISEIFTLPSVQSTLVPTDANLVDLTYTLDSNTLHWLTARPYEMTVKHNGTITSPITSATFWYQSEDIQLSTHTGTHLDAPCHFARSKWCVADIPIDHLINRPIALVDVTKECMMNRAYEVTVADIEKNEQMHGVIEDGAIVLFKTGWSRFWPIKEQYFGTSTDDPSQARFPGISFTASSWLANNRAIVGVAIEGPSIDSSNTLTYDTHSSLFSKNIYAIENLPNLHKIPPRGATLTVFPLKLDNASGSPVRVIANITSSPYNRQSVFSSLMPHSSSAPLPSHHVFLTITCLFMSLILL